jgi:hypothetical protein
MPSPGEIWLDSDFYGDGGSKRKYLLVMAVVQGDIVFRYLTSQQHGRPTAPACFHGNPYQAFYIGILGGPLFKDTWVDLSQTDDLDTIVFARLERVGQMRHVTDLNAALFCAVLRCTAQAPFTDNLQSRRIYDVVASRGCP